VIRHIRTKSEVPLILADFVHRTEPLDKCVTTGTAASQRPAHETARKAQTERRNRNTGRLAISTPTSLAL
jgi:hypothetical protein